MRHQIVYSGVFDAALNHVYTVAEAAARKGDPTDKPMFELVCGGLLSASRELSEGRPGDAAEELFCTGGVLAELGGVLPIAPALAAAVFTHAWVLLVQPGEA